MPAAICEWRVLGIPEDFAKHVATDRGCLGDELDTAGFNWSLDISPELAYTSILEG